MVPVCGQVWEPEVYSILAASLKQNLQGDTGHHHVLQACQVNTIHPKSEVVSELPWTTISLPSYENKNQHCRNNALSLQLNQARSFLDCLIEQLENHSLFCALVHSFMLLSIKLLLSSCYVITCSLVFFFRDFSLPKNGWVINLLAFFLSEASIFIAENKTVSISSQNWNLGFFQIKRVKVCQEPIPLFCMVMPSEF